MIEISENIKNGDLVYAWYSPYREKSNKKPDETEYRVGYIDKHYLKLESPNGGYSVMFGRELLETWFGNVRRAK